MGAVCAPRIGLESLVLAWNLRPSKSHLKNESDGIWVYSVIVMCVALKRAPMLRRTLFWETRPVCTAQFQLPGWLEIFSLGKANLACGSAFVSGP